MERIRRVVLEFGLGLLFVVMIMGTFATVVYADTVTLTQEEQNWLTANKGRVLNLGLDPQAGMEHFIYDEKTYGYVYELARAIERDLGIQIHVETEKSWGEVFSGISTGSIDILIGANETAERKKFMAFTRPIYQYPYALFSQKDSNIETIGDIDGKEVAFIEGDIVAEYMPEVYGNIKYKPVMYPSQKAAMEALAHGNVRAFITSGGEVAYEYIQRYPQIRYVSKINTITSDMTLSTNIKDRVFAGILDKELDYLENTTGEIKAMLEKAEIKYNRKLMNLSPEEKAWLENDGKAVVGITMDYLPIDYFQDGKYLGISGAILSEIGKRTGIEFEYVYSDFGTLYSRLEKGTLNILNIAKTEDRIGKFIYPQPYLLERDTIYGRKDRPDVLDVYGLEGKKVAVVQGFWHEELLKKNLTNVTIVHTNTIQESMELVHKGEADYFIENPSVVRYYIEELDLYDIMQKGITSNDSYLYYGISVNRPELASIIDKVIPLLSIQELAREGFNQVPRKSNFERNRKLFMIIIVLTLLLAIVAVLLGGVFRTMVRSRAKLMLMEAREEFLYRDPLTGLYNRNYLNDKIVPMLETEERLLLLVCDMNDLKKANDQYGHAIGDQLLQSYGKFLESVVGDEILIRLGGDEFLILVPSGDDVKAKEIITSLSEMKRSTLRVNEDTNLDVWGAYGYFVRTEAMEPISEMIKAADLRMYEVKRSQKKETRA